ncbi:MAG: hypothetical protein UU08_C0007G0016 [Candidatus Uhrbacteria bacterium GW2011_GWE2_40_58]|nr:MAG: hypothetical protein UT94_C0015G0016 [Candidatus Uhrbacteria bacterium GW2011_GWF2_40_263]KKR67862.1 MAG: hypothetical protein UU08_C0007G0016 [Candidatus Uhrbacteria bacterium GW2011_GWE2_40_58]HCB55518.1 hypothetical protein [Candidatus Uhrbacteria bacterium]
MCRLRSKKLASILFGMLLITGFCVALPTFAQTEMQSQMETFGEIAGFTTSVDITVIIARLIRTAISLLGIVAVVFVVYAGFLWMTAGGDKERVTKARGMIINALIGLVIVLSAFTITQFVLRSLEEATGRIITEDPTDYSEDPNPSTSSTFYLASLNTDCAESVKNLQLQFVFSQRVSSSTVESAISIEVDGGEEVEGTFTTSGYTVTFTPDAFCSETGFETEHCFSSSTSYIATVSPTILRSTSGRSLSCSSSYPCSYSFTIGADAAIDVSGPTMTMEAPEDEGNVYATGENELLQTEAVDDVGVSSVNFYVDSEEVETAGLDLSVYGVLSALNYFNSDTSREWNTEGYLTNETYAIYAVGSDCAGNSDTSDRITITLRAANCANDVIDTDLGETGLNCGGDISSEYYCGACGGDACTEDSQCASGTCEEGICVTVPKISRVRAGNGAPGNLITISGEGFGTDPGSITFLGTESGDEVEVSAYSCGGTLAWQADQIIVQVPEGAIDGPIQVTVVSSDESEGDYDRTDDDYGPYITDFDVNAIERPGLCSITPSTGEGNDDVTILGDNLGALQGSSALYFDYYEPTSYLHWETSEISAVTPLLDDGAYDVQVFAGDYFCETSGDVCSEDVDCGESLSESCVTAWCSETLEACSEDEDCGTGEGTCESIRQGSNEIDFTVSTTSSDAPPVISYVETGWQACFEGEHDGMVCTEDEDCGTGTCEDAPNWGPLGQYVTIYGTEFGHADGLVYFTNNTGSSLDGVTAIGDSVFPVACGSEYWTDTSILIKVPEQYSTATEDILETGSHTIHIYRGTDGQTSESVAFEVIAGEPGPSICLLDPDSGPVGSLVDIYGENFQTTDGSVTYYLNQTIDSSLYTSWDDGSVLETEVPDNAQTGPVTVTSAEGYRSNPLNFQVGNCVEDSSICSLQEECCSDGTCASFTTGGCPETVIDSHYAYKFTTRTIANTPRVRVACSSTEGIASPSPWEGWSPAESVCVNADIGATFDMDMKGSSLTSSNLVLEKCSAIVGGTCVTASGRTFTCTDVCDTLEEVPFVWSFNVGTRGFTASHAEDFETSTTYQVTLLGGDEAGRIQADASAGEGYLEEDFTWSFTTAPTDASCEVGDVYVSPDPYTARTLNESVGYLASLVSDADECVLSPCTGETLYWSSSDSSAKVSEPSAVTGSCQKIVTALDETSPGIPALIESQVTSASTQPVGDADLIIDFSDPEVGDYVPNCSTACVNAGIYAEFEALMDTSLFNSSNVKLYQCEDALCAPGELTEVTCASVGTATTQKVTISTSACPSLEANTHYRVWLSGNLLSTSGVALADSGSNYGGPFSENAYYPTDFSWIFTTKNSDISCGIDRIELDPEQATLDRIGARQVYEAVPYGAPDDCAVSGQVLQSSSYSWEPWLSTQPTVAEMLESGAISLSTDLPAWCSASCLNTGATVSLLDPVCGDGITDYNGDGYHEAEDCDGEGGCSDACFWEGTSACPFACEDSGATCTTDASCSTFFCQIGGAVCTTDASCTTYACETSGLSCLTDADCDTETEEVCAEVTDVCVEQTDICSLVPGGCCGDGFVSVGEECDDSNSVSGDGCSLACQNEGSTTTCGDGRVDYYRGTGGEDCDDGNTSSGDGCSSRCLFEGAVAITDIEATCGDGDIGNGEDCDDGNTSSGDGCSSRCLFEGASACVFACFDGTSYGVNCISDGDCESTDTCQAISTPCCGDGITDYNGDDLNDAEDCDLFDVEAGDGCSAICLNEGASVDGLIPSYCGDGLQSTYEECETTSSISSGAFAVAQVSETVAEEVDPITHYAVTTIQTEAERVTAEGLLSVECSCQTDADCGSPEESYGCGTGGCCYLRPETGSVYPESGATNVCQNTALWVEFSQDVDLDSLDPSGNGTDPQIYLEYTGTVCPTGWETTVYVQPPEGVFARAWHWIREQVLSFFGREVSAETTVCAVPVTYQKSDVSDGGVRVSVRYSGILEEGATYRLVVLGDSDLTDAIDEGVLNTFGVGLVNPSEIMTSFTVGNEICSLDQVVVVDFGRTDYAEYESASEEFFTEIGEVHYFMATAYHLDGAVQEEITSSEDYAWEWTWGSTEETVVTTTTASESGSDELALDDHDAFVTAEGEDGGATVFAQATVTIDTYEFSTEHLCETSGISCETSDDCDTGAGEACTVQRETVQGELPIWAMLCENPWISGNNYHYLDSSTNFSFSYCRDEGDEGTDDDLPALGNSTGMPIEVHSISSSIYQELLFQVQGTSDALGVRVVTNDDYTSPLQWYEDQGFSGSPSQTTLDGYQAVEEGTTQYVLATNQSGNSIYPNMYVISYNEDAGEESLEIFDRILRNWQFNANTDVISDVNLCANTNGYIHNASGDFIACEWDGDCGGTEICEAQANETYACSITGESCTGVTDNSCPLGTARTSYCDAEKAKLQRDTKRLSDAVDILDIINTHGETYAHCSVTTDTSCTQDDDCLGTETCVPDVPLISAGSYIPSMTISNWPSWNAVLSNELQETLPVDPLNAFYQCTDDGYDSDSCWNGTQGLFKCPSGSHVYGYRGIGGEEFILSLELEYNGGAWAYPIDTDSTDSATLSVEYSGGYTTIPLQIGFISTEMYCSGTTVGNTGLCGDGILNPSIETCELGDTDTASCTTLADDGVTVVSGLITIRCDDDCLGYQTALEAETAGTECIAYSCGNGTVEGTEICDDGVLNGTYGYCDDNCTYTTSFYCGDGYLAGGEQCDCGTTANWSTVKADTSSWAYTHCDITSTRGSNGQYVSTYAQSCAFDCSTPGPTCGDQILNGTEVCDGEYEEWEGALCADGNTCTTSADCEDGSTCGGTYVACGTIDGYQAYRYRTCSSGCVWNTWSACVIGDQQCGNGVLEGDEICDDGNTSNNDACLNTCEWNVCGDDYVYTGVESCDQGSENGDLCTASYGGMCQYCTVTCEYKTSSGAYCGDGTINGGEYCDGTVLPYRYFDADTRAVSNTCASSAVGTTSGIYTCLNVGVCNGGEDNGDYCTIGATGADAQSCATGGTCVQPVCASDCASSCPFSYETVSLQVQSELSGASKQQYIDLYRYLSGESPDNGVIYLPACSVGVSLTADIEADDVVPNDIDIVFVTDLSDSMYVNPEGTRIPFGADGFIEIESTRIYPVVEATSASIAELFDAASALGVTLHIGLVSFNGTAVTIDQTFSTSESSLVSTIEGYLTRLDTGTPTASGLQEAIDLFVSSSTAPTKIIVLLSDGAPTVYLDGLPCGTDKSGCIQEIREELIGANPSIQFYSAVIATSSSVEGYMAHCSSEECGTDWSDASDCHATQYAYQASDAEGITTMYEAIADAIVGATMTLTTESGSTTITTTGVISEGNDRSLPFPEAFICESSEFTIPLRVEFNGEGTMRFEDFQFEYCPL